MSALVLYEKRGRTAIVTLNRPDVLNALNTSAHRALYDIWTDFERDPEIWTAVLTGAGERAFCVGADINEIASRHERISASTREAARSPVQFGGLVRRAISKPIIAAVRGYCLGGGFELALACDLVVAATDAQFGFPEARTVGAYPSSGGVHRLPRQIPLKVAMFMLMTGNSITAETAHGFGLVNLVVSPDGVLPAALDLAERVNESSPLAVRAIKNLVQRSLDLPLDAHDGGAAVAWELEDAVCAMVWESEDWKTGEAVRAFRERRKPQWKGR